MGTGEKKITLKMLKSYLFTVTCVTNELCLSLQKNTCILPEDLRDFYLTTDGFTLTWSVKLDGR